MVYLFSTIKMMHGPINIRSKVLLEIWVKIRQRFFFYYFKCARRRKKPSPFRYSNVMKCTRPWTVCYGSCTSTGTIIFITIIIIIISYSKRSKSHSRVVSVFMGTGPSTFTWYSHASSAGLSAFTHLLSNVCVLYIITVNNGICNPQKFRSKMYFLLLFLRVF